MINIRDKGAELWETWNRPKRITFVLVLIGLVGLLPYAGDFSFTSILNTPISSYQAVLVYPVGMFVLMALGLNIVVGKSGLLDLGYVAFFAIGAYSAAILGTKTHLNIWEILPIGMGLAMISGVLLGLPTLRLRGDYLAIVTLGFGEIVRIVAVNNRSTGGPNGIANVPNPPSIFGVRFALDNMKGFFWIIFVMILLVIWMVRRLSIRRPGRAWEAIRQDEDVAMLMGVPILRYKIWSFSIGAAIGGAAGVIFASKSMYVAPDMFTFNTSVLILSCVVFGGMGNIWGVVLGGTILAYLPERIRFINNARQLVFGLALVVIMNVRPDGLLPRKKREKIAKVSAKPEGDSNV
ncbi:MAG: branched-chain amino acid ABC transporter permease [Actinomycetes bacterium]|jgi:branched-chain amino acid transport system permease protein